MKYTKEERLNIGRQIFEGEMTVASAAAKYDINLYTARDYLRLYKAQENLIIPSGYRSGGNQDSTLKESPDKAQYEQMTREELMEELIKAKINEARAKKGYEVKGDGQNKEFIPLSNKNSKS